jgi:membrane-associated protease RseP (regulator of RpoE activity)
MNKNVGGVDKIARIVGGLVLISLVFIGPQTPWGWIGLVLLGTGLINFCPIYPLLGINTAKTKGA